MKILVGLIVAMMLAAPLQAGSIQPFVSGSMAEIRGSMAGAPGIISFWSVDCPPCYRELAMLAKMQQRYPQLQLALVSADDLSLAEEVQGALRETGAASLPSWQFADPFAQKLRFEVDSSWQGELPRSYLLAPDGKTLAVSGVLAAEKIERWLQQFRLDSY